MSTSEVEVREARARELRVTEEDLVVELVDGRTLTVPLAWFPRLWHGTATERAHLELIGDGAYIHWPELDEDLSVVGLLAGRPSRENAESLKRWLEARKK